ncbi:MAG: glycosyltransferase [Actinomycetota bacterium]|nr:glycosyltransferase [Actinomycetota bacterium]
MLDLAAAQQQDGTYRPLILTPRASRDYLQRLDQVDLEVLSPGLFRPDRYHRLPRQRGITLIHAHGYEANYLVAAMRALCRCWRRMPLVVTAHGWIETTTRLRLHSHLDRYCARLAHVRIATAARHAPRFHAGQGVVVVIPNGVPDRGCPHALMNTRTLIRAFLGVPPKATIIGSVGRLSPEKRVDLVLAVAYRLTPHHPDLHVLVIGGGEQRAKLKELAQRLGLGRRVRFTGLLQDVTPALIAMDLLLQPSDTEGTPRTVLEAMAHRVPVVATDVGDVAELLDQGRCGELVPPGDADLLAGAVGHLLANPTRAQNLVQCARLRYEDHYSIEIMQRRVEEAYQAAHRAYAQQRRP